MFRGMSRVIVGREYFVLPTSDILTGRTADELLVCDPRAGPSAQSATGAGASAPSQSDDAGSAGQNPGAQLIDPDRNEAAGTDPMIAATRRQLAARAPETYSAPIPSGARLFRVGSNQAFAMLDGSAMIGRDRDSDLVVPGPAVSRRHGIVRRSPRGYVLTDVSRNGTYVNGRRVRGAQLLRTGDVVRIGDEEFRFEMAQATPYAGVAVVALLAQRLAHLRSAVPLADIARRLATLGRPHTEAVLSHLRSLRRLARIALWRTCRMSWARAALRHARSLWLWAGVSYNAHRLRGRLLAHWGAGPPSVSATPAPEEP